jgi:hypothetical protein
MIFVLLLIAVLLVVIWWQIAADERLLRRALDFQTQRILERLEEIEANTNRQSFPREAWEDDLSATHPDRL